MFTLGPVTNGKVNDTGRTLSRWIDHASCRRIAIASAYVTSAGLRSVIGPIKRAVLQRGISVRILISVKDCFTEPGAVTSLMRLSSQCPDRMRVRLSRNPRFHAKVYLFDLQSKAVCIAGSANVTAGGMRTDGELSVQIETSMTDRSTKRIWRWFDDQWEGARDVREDLLSSYRLAYEKGHVEPAAGNDHFKRLLRLLQVESPVKGPVVNEAGRAEHEAKRPIWWQATIQGTLSDASMKVLRTHAHWFRQSEPELICFPSLPPAFHKVHKRDRAVVFDFSSGETRGWVYEATIIDSHDYPATDDGRYFLVLKPKKRPRKKLSKKYRASLVERGFVRLQRSLRKTRLRPLGKRQLRIVAEDLKIRL